MHTNHSSFLSRWVVPYWFLAVAVGSALLSGCAAGAGGSQSTSQPPEAVSISTHPSSQTIPIGRTATFKVVASGTGPLQYEWSKNGAPIAGATSASYSTPVVAPSDSGETFQVTVSNSVNSVGSTVATLTAGPRAPAVGDLRYLLFEQVTGPGLQGIEHTNILGSSSFWANNMLGTRLEIGSNDVCYPGVAFDCAWGPCMLYPLARRASPCTIKATIIRRSPPTCNLSSLQM